MTDVIVSIMTPKAFSLNAVQWKDVEFDIEYLDIKNQFVSSLAFSPYERGAQIPTFINKVQSGRYMLIEKNPEKFVLAKGDIDKIRS